MNNQESISKRERVALTSEEVIQFYPELTRSKGVLANWRLKKVGPRYYKIGSKVVYRIKDIEEFLFRNPVLTRDCID
ncbi:MAG: hypothetical protein A4E66_00821 [Syntrophus sp. PtaB.Bin001]|nr:MAG: hypothetical protein A4E66_00821 [Syntrophus sp. PtaB.Bin001]